MVNPNAKALQHPADFFIAPAPWKCAQNFELKPVSTIRPHLPNSIFSSKIIPAPLTPKAQSTGGPVAGTTQSTSPIAEIDVLCITAGLGCDGDTIAMTAATQPSIEDIVLGGMPWIPKVNFHNLFLSITNGDEFLDGFLLRAEDSIDAFILALE